MEARLAILISPTVRAENIYVIYPLSDIYLHIKAETINNLHEKFFVERWKPNERVSIFK